MKKVLIPIFGFLIPHTAFANTPHMKLGYGVYVGGLHIGNIESHLFIHPNKTYTLKAYARSTGFTDILARLLASSTSTGTITKQGTYKWNTLSNISTARFGDNYSILVRQDDNTTKLTRYPDRNEVNLKNLEGNPLAMAHDPMATFLNMMVQVGKSGSCSQNLIVVANHFLYRMNTVRSYTYNLPSTQYNVASADTLACDLKFVRLDKEKTLSAYTKVAGQGDGQNTPPTIFFKKMPNIPYALPVLVRAKEQRFGAFRMHLQFVKFKDITLKSEKWNTNESFTQQNIQSLDSVKHRLLGQ